MSWASIILTGLKLLTAVMNYLNEKRLIQAGEDRAVARAALELLERTAQGKELRDRVNRLTDTEAADLWERMRKV